MVHAFHIHTYRCGHAADEPDEQYVKTALSLGADKITFTDHVPYPGDEIPYRMPLSLLQGYIDSLKLLREKYRNQIEIEIGLEAEYFPSRLNYYSELKANPDLDLLILGQHFFEHDDGQISLYDEDRTSEYVGSGNAIIQGIESGLFKVVAHPDRIFRDWNEWTPGMTEVSEKIIKAAAEKDLMIERNLSSYEQYVTGLCPSLWKNEFWEMVERHNSSSAKKVKIIEGLDAHSSRDMTERFKLRFK